MVEWPRVTNIHRSGEVRVCLRHDGACEHRSSPTPCWIWCGDCSNRKVGCSPPDVRPPAMTGGRKRAGYVGEGAAAVPRQPASDGSRGASSVVLDGIVVGGRPRLIASPGKLGPALFAHPGLRRPRERWQRRTLAAALAVRADRWSPGGSVRRERHVVACEPSPGPHAVAFDVAGLAGTPRFMTVIRQGDDHYKPTLTLLDDKGCPVGYAKLGWTIPTAAMVRREARALESMVALSGSLRAPTLLGEGAHAGRPLLVTAPLPPGLFPSPSLNPPDVLTPFAGTPRAVTATTSSPRSM